MSIKSLPEAERPRERLAKLGSEALSTPEILAILLGSGTQNCSVLQLASALLGHFGSLNALSEATIEELKVVKGIGNAKAIQLKAVFSLLHRFEPRKEEPILDDPNKVYASIKEELEHQKVEMLLVILRDVRRRFLHREIVCKGTMNEILLHPREIFHLAIRHRAHNVILAHNHPTGDPTPSSRDVQMTSLVAHAGRVVGIEVMDHLIVGKGCYLSFYEKGLMKNMRNLNEMY